MTAPAQVGGSKSFATAIVGNLFPPVASLITAPILAHALGPLGRGEVAGATAPLALLIVASTFGLPEAATYSIARLPAVAKVVAKRAGLMLVGVGIVATVLVVLCRGLLAPGNSTLQQNILVASLALTPCLLIAMLRGVAMGMHRWRAVAASRGGDALARLGLVSALALTGHLTVFSATLVIAYAPIVGGLMLLPTLRALPKTAFTADGFGTYKSMMGFGVRVWFGAISGVLLMRLDQVLMVPLAGAYELGLYVVAVAVSEVPLIVNSAVRDVVFASDAASADAERLGLASRLSTTVTFSIALALALSIQWWLPFVFGDDFRDAIPVALVLMLAITAGNPGSVAGAGLSARGRPGLRSMSLLIAAVVNTTLVLVLVPALGAMGAAIATAAGSIIASNMNIIFLWRFFGIRPLMFYAFRPRDLKALAAGISKMLSQRRTT